jgi:hypothetical protein
LDIFAFTGEKNFVSILSTLKSARFKLSLLPDRPVVVFSLALKEAVMHHAEPQQQYKDNKESEKNDLQCMKQGCFSLRIGRGSRGLCHSSCLVLGYGALCCAEKCAALSRPVEPGTIPEFKCDRSTYRIEFSSAQADTPSWRFSQRRSVGPASGVNPENSDVKWRPLQANLKLTGSLLRDDGSDRPR